MLNTAPRSQPNEGSCPPTIDPTTEPTRPTALAQLTPVVWLADVRNPSGEDQRKQPTKRGGIHHDAGEQAEPGLNFAAHEFRLVHGGDALGFFGLGLGRIQRAFKTDRAAVRRCTSRR
jgi:hypothetical protein